MSRSLDDVVPPTQDQLKLVYAQIESKAECSVEELLEVCSQAGISSHHVVDVISASGLDTSTGNVNPNVVLMLLLATTSYSLSSVVASIFTSLGTEEQLAKEEFLKLFTFLAEADKSLPEHSVETMKEELGHLDDSDFISFSIVSETAFMKNILTMS